MLEKGESKVVDSGYFGNIMYACWIPDKKKESHIKDLKSCATWKIIQ